MKITAGPMVKRYAEIYGCDVDEVVAWMSGYVNGPWPDAMIENVEATEQERAESIKGYVSAMVNCSSYQKIRSVIDAELLAEVPA